ncbi:DUF2459 domain-containing protein [Aurantiacibacter rhizosphaerae]|uniref:DUF2459 domain-containing protein n=1 Tax=Aurantiacibacter rhizosphaerae TaxID=2691582 RepID=A0A844XFD6_9SPHN|nr:DUF2459 domain-containing protein [Aurantiacibacter rhizosphaerae]MWV28225.1 DUF2459 domain-containing protein [Aurantiacibacter rhizosphaerae]
MRRLRRIALVIGALLALVIAGYPLAGWIGSSIPHGEQTAQPPQPDDSIEILVETNGTHTGIVVPVVSPAKDWRTVFPSAAMPDAYGRVPTHLSIGWGEREVFLHVATWADLRPATALRIATVGGDALMRVSNYVRPMAGPNHRPVRISSAQYARLVSAIERPLPTLSAGQSRKILSGTYADDAYYEASGTYSLANNCNSWVGETLAEAGLPMGAWTPFAGGVMKWIPERQLPER